MMTRFLTVGAAQMGPIQRSDTRRDVVERLIAHLREAKRMGCELVVFPELTLTTFFPRWWMTDQAEINSFFEHEMPSNETAPLFNEAKRLAMGFCLGYAELAHENGSIRHFNTSIMVERDGRSSASTARSICRAMPSTSPSGRSSISRSATSRSAISVSRCSRRSAATWACASATTGAGPRPIG